MPTFLDESGDTGSSAGGSPSFRLCAVTVPTEGVADAIRAAIRHVRATLRLGLDYEFKFSKTIRQPGHREAFFQAVLRHEFGFATVSLDKRRLVWESSSARTCLWLTTTALATVLRPVYSDRFDADPVSYRKERVTLDDNQDQEFLTIAKDSFRTLGTRDVPRRVLVGRVTFSNSGPEDMLQLADMLCGAVGAMLDGDDSWYRIVAARDLTTWRFPG